MFRRIFLVLSAFPAALLAFSFSSGTLARDQADFTVTLSLSPVKFYARDAPVRFGISVENLSAVKRLEGVALTLSFDKPISIDGYSGCSCKEGNDRPVCTVATVLPGDRQGCTVIASSSVVGPIHANLSARTETGEYAEYPEQRLMIVPAPELKEYTGQVSGTDRGCVGNLIWQDLNQDGIKTADEPGYGSITVDLLSENGSLSGSTRTNNGYFRLCARPGNYYIRPRLPGNLLPSPVNSGDDDYHDSDADDSGTVPVVIVAGRDIGHYDTGVVSVSVSGNSELDSRKVTRSSQNDLVRPSSRKILLGPWVDHRHRNDGVFKRFNAALLWVTPEIVLDVLNDARRSGTHLFIQLGSAGEWGWNFDNNTSDFTMRKWKASVDRFARDSRVNNAIRIGIEQGVIRGIYLIDEPHHPRWSPDGASYNYIRNRDIDEMARYIKSFWPKARTSVRSSARTLVSYERERIVWEHLDESFLMINYRKWSNHGIRRTIDGFLRREVREYIRQGLGAVGSIQMLIGAPVENKTWWPAIDSGGAAPVGKLKASPIELKSYFDAFMQPRDIEGRVSPLGKNHFDAVMIFRWDRNDESDWENAFYDSVIRDLSALTAQLH